MTFLITGKKEDCCGCGSCYNVCNHDAIEMVADKEGFFYPRKNLNCVDCGLCEKACPYSYIVKTNKSVGSETPKTFAAYSEKDRKGSSSGGVFFVLAKDIINRGGTVYGAAFDNDLQLKHISANSIEDLAALRGSKYLQSNIGFCYREIKRKLYNDELVFFVGTPCQVAGLKSFIGKNFSNLLTADIVCHGTPSQWLFDQHRKYLEKKHRAKLIHYQFRDNDGWGGCEIADFVAPHKRVINPTYELSPYLYSFMHCYTFRWSCYECPFSRIPRSGDLTLGDYWGVKRVFPTINTNGGVSVIIVNNSKGMYFLNEIKTELIIIESELAEASKENGNIIGHSEKPAIRDKVYQLARENGYDCLAKNEFRSPKYKLLKRGMVKEKFFITPLRKVYSILFKK